MTPYEPIIRASWQKFVAAYDEMLDLALRQDNLDEGTSGAILGRLLANIHYSGLLLKADPAHPELINPQYAAWNWGHPNPDTLYLAAVIDDAHDYRVFGRLGSVAQTTFGVYTGFADQSTSLKILADQLPVEADGSFELFFTREPDVRSNSYQLPIGARTFGCYQTFNDWQAEAKGQIRIECLSSVDVDAPRGPTEIAERFDTHTDEARQLFDMWVRDIPERVFNALPRNQATPAMQPPAAMAGAWFSVIPWELAHDQAIVIDYELPPGSPYVGICLTNDWGEMIEPRTRQTSLTMAQSRTVGGHVRVLVSAADLGVHNWLDARGYRRGIVTWRASTPAQPPPPTVTTIDIGSLDDYFEPNARVTADERCQILRARERHFATRDVP